MTTFSDMVSHLGGVPLGMSGIPYGPDSKVFFVSPATGSDTNDGQTPATAFAGIEAGEAALTANRHDTLVYLAGSSGNNLAAALTWDKNYTHLIGMCAPTGVANRARIFQTSTLTGASPLVTVSATGCIFKNFYCFQGVDDATSLINWSITGGRNYFENVHFAGGGHATMAINGCASLHLNAAEENLFRHCTFGVDTITAATGVTAVLMDGEAHRNIFEDCNFTLYAGNANVFFVEVVDSTGFDRYNIFKRCLFSNTSSTSMDTAFEIPAGVGAPRTMYVINSFLHGADDWDDGDRGVVFLDAGTITAGGNAGIMQATAAT
jgi:hypothetical protein